MLVRVSLTVWRVTTRHGRRRPRRIGTSALKDPPVFKTGNRGPDTALNSLRSAVFVATSPICDDPQ